MKTVCVNERDREPEQCSPRYYGVLKHLSGTDRNLYRKMLRCGVSKEEALRAVGRADLVKP